MIKPHEVDLLFGFALVSSGLPRFPLKHLRLSLWVPLLSCGMLASQVPEGWAARQALGADLPTGSTWYGGGVWAADKHGPPATLIDSLGLGNSLTGGGISVEGGTRQGAWSFAVKALAFRDTDGSNRLTVHQGHLTYQSPGNWRFGLEDEPLVWGYGLTGGYLLGEASRPFPKIRIETPKTPLGLFGCSLGTWGFEWFTGRLENGRKLADNNQDPSYRARIIQATGDPQAPLMSGYRVDGSFLEKRVECYVNWTVLWGGNLNGVPMTSGYNLGEYLIAMTGMKDPVAETSIDFTDPNHPVPQYKNKARSSSNFDLGMRFQIRSLANGLGAEKAWGYISRGSKGVTLNWGVMAKKPLYWLEDDLHKETRFVLRHDYRAAWYESQRHLVPNLLVPNDAFGILVQWPGIRLGVERRNTVNPPGSSFYRSFENAIYVTGFYRDGDPLGEALGGEASYTSVKLDCDLNPRTNAKLWFIRGTRPFRDEPVGWAIDHPGAHWTEDRFINVQGDLAWKLDPSRTIRVGCAWEGHSSAGYIQGNQGNGFRWFAEFSTRWAR